MVLLLSHPPHLISLCFISSHFISSHLTITHLVTLLHLFPMISRIIGNIHISSLDALNQSTLDQYHLTHILSLLPGPVPLIVNSYTHLQIPINDDNSTNILHHLPDAFKFISTCLFNDPAHFDEKSPHQGSILIHCHEGLSRSVAVVICYLIKCYKLSLSQAMHAISRKQETNINPAFVKQLQLFDKCKGDFVMYDQEYKLFLFEFYNEDPMWIMDVFNRDIVSYKSISANANSNANTSNTSTATNSTTTNSATTNSATTNSATTNSATTNSATTNSTTNATANNSGTLRCKKCRESLAIGTQILNHSKPDELSHQSKFYKKSGNFIYASEKASSNCSHYFLQNPLNWMNLGKGEELDGKLNCIKCKSKIGGYSWKGSRCSCGKWIVPSFHLLTSKVDYMKT